jgi:hypothetical protein
MSYTQKAAKMPGGMTVTGFVRNLLYLLETGWNGSGAQDARDFLVWVFEREWSF